ncbi:MAG: hypothetical protein AMXMBFR13_09740 [Phycisphaerae bacterium]
MAFPDDGCSRRDFIRGTVAAGGLAALAGPAVSAPAPKAPRLPAGVLGRTKYPVTKISFGGILLAEALGTRVLKAGIDAGINLLHTSASYVNGKSIQAIGQLFKADAAYRERVFLALKSFTPDKDEELAHMLDVLGTDHTEVLLSTMDSADPARLDVIRRAQDSLKKRGKIRHTGFVCHGDMNGVVEMVLDKAPDYFDVALLATAMLSPSGDRRGKPATTEDAKRFQENLKKLHEKGVGLLSMKSGARKAVKQGEEIFPAHARSVLACGVDSLLTSIDTFQQVEMIQKIRFGPTSSSPAERQAEARFRESRSDACLMCRRCTGICPNGVPVADLMRVRMYHDEYGWQDHARNEFHALGAPARRVSLCGDCTKCTEVCPLRLASAATVQRVAGLFA